jgi:hypothetical protein
MTQARPKGASTGRLLLTSSSIVSQEEQVVGHDRVAGQLHSVDECRLAGRAWAVSGARPAKKPATAVPTAGP